MRSPFVYEIIIIYEIIICLWDHYIKLLVGLNCEYTSLLRSGEIDALLELKKPINGFKAEQA